MAQEVITYKAQHFEEIIYGFDFIPDTVGGKNFARSVKVLKPGGMIILLPSNKKGEAEKVAQRKPCKKLSSYPHAFQWRRNA